MTLNFQRRMALITVFLLLFGYGAQMPFGNERAHAGTGGEIFTVAGGSYGDSGDEGPAVDAEISYPSAVAVDGSGNLYIADTNNNKIRKVDAATLQITTVAGSGDYGYSGDEGSALLSQMRSPSGVALDDDGNLYIADKYNNRIRKVDPNGIISTIAGTGSSNYSGDNGPAVDAALSSPSGVAVDVDGNLYIADTGNNRIRKVDGDGIITTVAGKSDYGTFAGDGGPAIDAELYNPSAVGIDSDGNLYIADTDNNRIRKVDKGGIITTVAGSTGTDGYSGDGGLAVNAQLNEPEGIAIDGNGNLYIADTDNNRIRKVTPNGRILTIAGTGASDYSGDGGPGILAALDGPVGLAIDSNGNLYIADKYNYAIRMQVPYIPSSDASLSNITLSSGTLSPAFASTTFDYRASVVNGVSTIRVTPTTADPFITVEVNGESVASGVQSRDINLNVGENTITLVALAEDGVTTKTYTLTVERLRSSNANLSQLSLSDGTLSPAFSSNTTSYSANATQSAITVTPTTAEPLATVKINEMTVANGTTSQLIPLDIGSNTITVVVTAQDETTKTYTINVSRAISSNADLSGLSLSSGTLSPAFAAGTTSYTASVGNNVSSIEVTPTLADGTATVTVNEVPAASGVASAPLPLTVGSNTISVTVTAENGSTKTYTVNVTRAESSNADLNDLTLSNGDLIPSFIPGTFKSSVGFQVTGVTVTPTVSDTDHATVTVSLHSNSGTLVSGPFTVLSGTASPELPLSIGNNNVITVIVTAQDGTTKTYKVDITRAELNTAPPPAGGGGSSGGGGFSTPSVSVNEPVIDLNGQTLDPAGIDTKKAFVTLEVIPTDGAAYVSVPMSILTDLAVRNADFYLDVKTSYGSYRVPVNLAFLIPALPDLLTKNKLKAGDVNFKLTLTDKSGDRELQAALAKDLPNGKVMGVMVDFHIEILNAKTGQVIGSADQFSKTLSKVIPMPINVSVTPEQWGAFRYNDKTSKWEFVPAKAVKVDGVWHAVIDTYSNSTYVVAENVTSFADMKKHWGQSYVELAAAKGLVEGVGAGRFDPNKAVTRAEFTVMLVRALGRGTSAGSEVPYSDIQAGTWYFSSVKKAKELGLITFTRGNEFKPEQPINREEMASMLAGVIRLEKLPLTQDYVDLNHFGDVNKVNSAYIEDVRLMVKLHIMSGTSSNTFDPQGVSTRAQAAVVLTRMLGELGFIDFNE